jgi:hypothetical protein
LSGVATIASVLVLAADPSSYFFYSGADRARWIFPVGHVAIVCGVVLGEALIAASALTIRRPPRLWARCALALLILLPWAAYTFTMVMHAPRYVHLHHLWLASVLFLLALVLLVSGAKHVWSWSCVALQPD